MYNQIKQLREKKGWTQLQLAEAVGTTNQQIGRLEANKRQLTKQWAERLAPVLGTTASQLLFAADDNGFAEADALPDLSVTEIEGRPLTPNESVWKVGAKFATLPGYAPGDRFLLDMSLTPADGDDVLVNLHDLQGGAETLLRRYSRGWLVGSVAEPLQVTDGRVQIMGVIKARWWRRGE